MGGCCSRDDVREGLKCLEEEEVEEKEDEFYDAEDGSVRVGDGGARGRMKGSCQVASMFTQKGWKGVNQDAMTVWEDFAGNKDWIFCGVFDGHGPFGHKVASYVRDALPRRLHSQLKSLQSPGWEDGSNGFDSHGIAIKSDRSVGEDSDQWLYSLQSNIVKAFEDEDKELNHCSVIDSICSGTTAVTLVKARGHLIIANLGDSRVVLGARDSRNQPVPIQLTVDQKPDVPSEAERIKSCKGRVFALEEEPDVHRLWLPDEDCPGLAMARAFGDFCLKDYGLISTPQISYRKTSEKDDFVVLATDGVWDVLSNKEVVKIVASASKQSEAAKQVVQHAVRAWRSKHPTSLVDDCAVVCLFLKPPASATFPTRSNSTKSSELSCSESFKTAMSGDVSELEVEVNSPGTKQEWGALNGLSRVNSLVRLPRLASVLSWRKKSMKEEEEVAG